MDAIDIAFEVIDMRSFSNLWYWIALAVIWSLASHWVMGVPQDMIRRARRLGGKADADLASLARIYAERTLGVADKALLFVVGFACFWFTALGILAFAYDVEFAQALFCLMVPMIPLAWHRALTARHILTTAPEGEPLYRCLMRHRRVTQAVGMVAVTATALYGTYQNLTASILN